MVLLYSTLPAMFFFCSLAFSNSRGDCYNFDVNAGSIYYSPWKVRHQQILGMLQALLVAM